MQYTARTRHLTATVQEYDISLFVALELTRECRVLGYFLAACDFRS